MRIAFTKKVNSELKTQLLGKGIEIMDKQLVHTKSIIERSLWKRIQESPSVLVVTSSKALHALSEMQKQFAPQVELSKKAFTVGPKTTALAQSMGLELLGTGKDGKSVAHSILQSGAHDLLHITCENRLKEPSKTLLQHGIQLSTALVYRKEPELQRWPEHDGVAFFSPSQIEAYCQLNPVQEQLPVFCIGNTTAQNAAKKGFKSVYVAAETSETSIAQLIIETYLTNNE